MSRRIDEAVDEAERAMREALKTSNSPPSKTDLKSGAASYLSEETSGGGSGWGIEGLQPPSLIAGLVTVNHTRQVARSVKMYNILIDPLLALRNGLSAAKEATSIAGAGVLTSLFATGAVAVTGGLFALPMSLLAFMMAAHFTRRRDIQYDQACVLALAWGVSEYIDGYHMFTEADLVAALPMMTDFGIHDFNAAKTKTALSRLAAWGVLEKRGEGYVLHERLEEQR